jgi:hypothetical protein
MSVPVKIVVVYHSGYGHTVKIAEAVARGAAAINGASVELVTAEQAPGQWELLDGADAIIMGAPTYMGSLSAQELSAGRAALGRPANRGVSGGADNQDPEGRGVMASEDNQGTAVLATA